MQLWRRARAHECVAAEPYAGGRYGRCDHHGSHTHTQHRAIWHVPKPGQSDGDCRHGGGAGGVYTHAVYSGDRCTVDSGRRAHGAGGQYAGAEQQWHADVQLGRCDQGGDAWADDGDTALIGGDG